MISNICLSEDKIYYFWLMQITFIVNSKISNLKSVLQEIGNTFYDEDDFNTTILQTHHAGHSINLAEDATLKGTDYLIAVGGDGTLSEVLNGIMQAPIPINNYPILAVIPRGSANDFVKTVNASKKITTLREEILTKKYQKIDVGHIVGESVPDSSRYFINIASMGLGPEVVKAMESSNNILGTSLAYFFSIIKGFLTYEKRSIKCEAEDWSWEGKLMQMAIANGKYFGHGICVAPEASINDGILHISLFGEISLFDYLKNLGNLKKGKKINHTAAHYFTAKELKVSPTSQDRCGIEADGEFIGESPVTIKVIPHAIKFLMT